MTGTYECLCRLSHSENVRFGSQSLTIPLAGLWLLSGLDQLVTVRTRPRAIRVRLSPSNTSLMIRFFDSL